MEILMLVLFYYLSQNPDFAESLKPLMNQLKDSEQMLRFLNDLSNFSQTFSAFQNTEKKTNDTKKAPENESCRKKDDNQEEKNPQSPTSGIADAFIQNILDNYLKKQ